jgi:hypothetical protein
MDDVKFLATTMIAHYFRGINPSKDRHNASGRSHLLWMLGQVEQGKVEGDKAHRWIGFVQGALVTKGLATTPGLERINSRILKG